MNKSVKKRIEKAEEYLKVGKELVFFHHNWSANDLKRFEDWLNPKGKHSITSFNMLIAGKAPIEAQLARPLHDLVADFIKNNSSEEARALVEAAQNGQK